MQRDKFGRCFCCSSDHFSPPFDFVDLILAWLILYAFICLVGLLTRQVKKGYLLLKLHLDTAIGAPWLSVKLNATQLTTWLAVVSFHWQFATL